MRNDQARGKGFSPQKCKKTIGNKGNAHEANLHEFWIKSLAIGENFPYNYKKEVKS